MKKKDLKTTGHFQRFFLYIFPEQAVQQQSVLNLYIIFLIQDFEADFLWKVSLKMLKTFTNASLVFSML